MEEREAIVALAPLAVGEWCGEPDTLQEGAIVDVLAVDGAGRLRGDYVAGVPVRTACWIRHWPDRDGYAQYRSCDLADIELSDDDLDRLLALTGDHPKDMTDNPRGEADAPKPSRQSGR